MIFNEHMSADDMREALSAYLLKDWEGINRVEKCKVINELLGIFHAQVKIESYLDVGDTLQKLNTTES